MRARPAIGAKVLTIRELMFHPAARASGDLTGGAVRRGPGQAAAVDRHGESSSTRIRLCAADGWLTWTETSAIKRDILGSATRDRHALDEIATFLNGSDWCVDDIVRIAGICRATGREVRDPADDAFSGEAVSQ